MPLWNYCCWVKQLSNIAKNISVGRSNNGTELPFCQYQLLVIDLTILVQNNWKIVIMLTCIYLDISWQEIMKHWWPLKEWSAQSWQTNGIEQSFNINTFFFLFMAKKTVQSIQLLLPPVLCPMFFFWWRCAFFCYLQGGAFHSGRTWLRLTVGAKKKRERKGSLGEV